MVSLVLVSLKVGPIPILEITFVHNKNNRLSSNFFMLFSLYFLHSKAFQVITRVSQKIRTMKIAAGLMEVSKCNNTLTVFAEMVGAFYTELKARY